VRSPWFARPGAVPGPADAQPTAEPQPDAASGVPWPDVDSGVPWPDVDSGVPWHYGDPMREQRRLLEGAAVTDLSQRGLLTVTGPERLSWLHSLTTQHLENLPPGESAETLILSPHGHVEHSLHVVDDGETTWLSVEGGAAQAILEWLQGMRFRIKVQVADVSADWAAIGAVLAPGAEPPPALAAALAAGGSTPDGAAPPSWQDPWPAPGPDTGVYTDVAEHPGVHRPWREIWVARADLPAIAERLEPAGSWAAEALRVAAWRPREGREVDHRTLPHEADWLRSALHLNKGCYRGQETVSRVYRVGRPPRRLALLHLDGSEHVLPERGAEVFVQGEPQQNGADGAAARSIGTVTSAVLHFELGPIALALLKRNVPVDAALRVDSIPAAQEVVVQP